ELALSGIGGTTLLSNGVVTQRKSHRRRGDSPDPDRVTHEVVMYDYSAEGGFDPFLDGPGVNEFVEEMGPPKDSPEPSPSRGGRQRKPRDTRAERERAKELK
ncbi:hypothetical protein KIPB_016198, partial [Kipferlia bialata]